MDGENVEGNPDPRVAQAVEILEDRGYMAFKTLCRHLGVAAGRDSRAFKDALVSECQRDGAAIGVVSEERAVKAVINAEVFYSVDWADEHRTMLGLAPEQAVGYDLYLRIVDNGWNNYNELGMVNFRTLDAHDLNWIISCGRNGDNEGDGWIRYEKTYRLTKATVLYREGVEQRDAGNLAEGYEKMKQAAKLGLECAKLAVDQAWFETALMLRANPVDHDGYKRGGQMIFTCAQHGYAPAVFAAGEEFDKIPDHAEAKRYYARAAQDMPALAAAGDRNAQLALAKMFAEGKGLAKDIDQAKAWCQRSKDSGNADAEAFLVKLNGMV